MRADYKMTQTTLQGVMKGTDKLVKSKVEDILNEASGRIASGEDPQEVIDAMKLNNKIGSMFDGLEYQEKQQMFFKKNFGMVEPKKIPLPVLPEDFRRHRTRQDKKFHNQDYVVVPLLPQLAQLVKNTHVYREIKKKRNHVPGVYKSFEDGTNF